VFVHVKAKKVVLHFYNCFIVSRLVTTVGKDLDAETMGILSKGPQTGINDLSVYLKEMSKLVEKEKISSRVRFLMHDVIDLRLNGWKKRRRQVAGPKSNEQIHEDIEHEQLTQELAHLALSGPPPGRRDDRRNDRNDRNNDRRNRSLKEGPGGGGKKDDPLCHEEEHYLHKGMWMSSKNGRVVNKMLGEKPSETLQNKKESMEEKIVICWKCLTGPDLETRLYLCKGCKKARYCGDKCHEEDWDRHGNWCRMRRDTREERHRARREKETKRVVKEEEESNELDMLDEVD